MSNEQTKETRISKSGTETDSKSAAQMAEDNEREFGEDGGWELWSLEDVWREANRLRKERVAIAENWIYSGQVGLLTGLPKRGKSTTILDLIASVTTGTEWLNLIPTDEVPVLLEDHENNPIYWQDNLDPMLDAKGRSYGDTVGRLFVAKPGSLIESDGFDADVAIETIRKIQRRTGKKTGLMVIDTARGAFSGMFDSADWELSAGYVRRAVDAVRQVSRETGWSVIIVHHDAKSGKGPSGSGDWSGAVDFIIRFKSRRGGGRVMDWTGRAVEPPGNVIIKKYGATLQGRYVKPEDFDSDDSSGADSREGQIGKAIRTILQGKPMAKSRLFAAVREQWSDLGGDSIKPGKDLMRGVVDGMVKSGEILAASGPNNSTMLSLNGLSI